MKKISFVLLLPIVVNCFAQTGAGARRTALNSSDVISCRDPFAIFYNPASAALSSSRQIGFFYSPSPFELKELATFYAAYIQPTSIATFSAGLMKYGFELYNVKTIQTGIAFSFYEHFSAGINFSMQNLAIANYGSRNFFFADVGLTAQINDRVITGVFVKNITGTSIGDFDNQFPTVFCAGVFYKIIDAIDLYASLYKEIGYIPALQYGVEYNLAEFLNLRAGISDFPETYSGGIGITFKSFELGYSVNSHFELGLSHQFDIILRTD
ncbi:MAG: hypothetical protein ACOYVE_10790 [Melioribacter sp.]|uniref:hypothetical protein n=1 Tax=Melioribacter sp. TaxID=2052167 RepID=UPI003BCC00D1